MYLCNAAKAWNIQMHTHCGNCGERENKELQRVQTNTPQH